MEVVHNYSYRDKTLMSDTIEKKFIALCNAIDCNDCFLAGLSINHIITNDFQSKLKFLHSNLEKASKVLAFLRDSRTSADFSKFVDILRASCNSKAVEIITEPITLPSSTISYGYQGVVAGYIERQELQQQALQHLTAKPNRDTRVTFPVVVLHGFGGNGKSQMARRLVQVLTKEANDSSKCSVWINAATKESVIEGFRNFAGDRKEENMSIVMSNIYRELKLRNLLLVFDDGDDFEMLKEFFPLDDTETNVRVIITAHSGWVCGDQNVKNILVSNFTIAEFSDFVNKCISCRTSVPDFTQLKKYTSITQTILTLVRKGFSQLSKLVVIIFNTICKKFENAEGCAISEKDIKQLEGYTGRIPAILSLVCKGFSLRFKLDKHYTISKHFKKLGDEIFAFGEDGKLVPGLKESDYKKSARIVVEQQLACMENWDYVIPELIDLAKFILNRIAYCDSNEISEEHFFMKHPQILRKANGDYDEVRQAIGILAEFGWIEAVRFDSHKKLEVYSIHACYQIGLKSILDQRTSESILYGMIEYIQANNREFMVHEKRRHQFSFWPHVSSHSNCRALLNFAPKANSCLLGLVEMGLMDDVKSLADAYQDKGELVNALLQCNIEQGLFPSSPMFHLFRKATNHELARYVISKIKVYHDHLEDSEKKAWIRQQILWAIIGVIYSNEFDVFNFTLDNFDLNARLGGYSDSLLHWACFLGNLEFVQLLIDNWVNVNVKNTRREPALHFAAASSGIKIVQLLINSGANVNEKDMKEDTALHWAIREGKLETVKFLVENGANINDQDAFGNTAVVLAFKWKKHDIVDYIRSIQQLG